MNQKLETVRDNLVETIGHLSSNFGLNPIVGRMYALLFMSASPLSLDHMANELKISKGNVSVNIRELERWGAVKKVWVRGSRKDFYEANLNTLQIIIHRLKAGIQCRIDEFQPEVDKIEKMLQSGDDTLSVEEKRTVKVYRERFGRIKRIQHLVQTGMERIPEGFIERLF